MARFPTQRAGVPFFFLFLIFFLKRLERAGGGCRGQLQDIERPGLECAVLWYITR
jgi:hypothetical protein